MCVYNGMSYLRQQVQSVLDQTFNQINLFTLSQYRRCPLETKIFPDGNVNSPLLPIMINVWSD